jgi:hypothetical protein
MKPRVADFIFRDKEAIRGILLEEMNRRCDLLVEKKKLTEVQSVVEAGKSYVDECSSKFEQANPGIVIGKVVVSMEADVQQVDTVMKALSSIVYAAALFEISQRDFSYFSQDIEDRVTALEAFLRQNEYGPFIMKNNTEIFAVLDDLKFLFRRLEKVLRMKFEQKEEGFGFGKVLETIVYIYGLAKYALDADGLIGDDKGMQEAMGEIFEEAPKFLQAGLCKCGQVFEELRVSELGRIAGVVPEGIEEALVMLRVCFGLDVGRRGRALLRNFGGGRTRKSGFWT